MAGAGKSTVGKELAKILNFRFIDSDTLIEEQHGKSLQKMKTNFQWWTPMV